MRNGFYFSFSMVDYQMVNTLHTDEFFDLVTEFYGVSLR